MKNEQHKSHCNSDIEAQVGNTRSVESGKTYCNHLKCYTVLPLQEHLSKLEQNQQSLCEQA